jgi:ppGpp synthetase/RelA/SpoT-type nucleotidyltranferase
MNRFELFDKDMTLYLLYINLDDSIKDIVGLRIITSVYNIFGISFLDHPFNIIIHSIKNSIKSKYD